MLRSRKAIRLTLLIGAAIIGGSLLAGCSAKDDKPTGPGYYDGPMAKKGTPKAPADAGKLGNP